MTLFHHDFTIAVLVATANRQALLTRALRSVERQTLSPAHVVVVDDSSDAAQGAIERLVTQFANGRYLRNSRSKGASGAWNDGLDHLLRISPDPRLLYVAILDDDDEWDPEHLKNCFNAATSRQLDMVAAPLWRHEDGAAPKVRVPPEALDPDDFLIGNPNIQGSNLFCRLSVLLEAGLFDEWLPSCTDRDLCIRIADLPGVLYGTTEKVTVHHHASDTHRRLSTPGGRAKDDGLSRFFAKYRSRMSSDQQAAFRTRAARLFGWQPARPSSRSAPNDSAQPKAPKGPAPHLIVGTVADASSLDGLPGLLADLRSLARSELAGLDVLILENGLGRHPSSRLHDLVDRERRCALRIALVDRARHIKDANAGRVLDGGVTSGGYLPIAPARTALQSYLYAFAKRRPGAIVWIVDDDLRLDPLVADDNGHLQRQAQPVLPALRELQAWRDSGRADVVIGRCTGDPPVPFAATVRTQMVDLVATLMWLAGQSPDALLPDRAAENAALRQGRRDYYYDLSRRETDRLETPFWMTPEEPGERVGAVFARLACRAERILAGEQLFRPLVFEAGVNPLECGTGLQRGGNTFVLDLEALRLAPNPSAMVNGRPTRRSDMMWALLQERHFGRKVVTIPLALHQDRSGTTVDGLDVDKILDDMRGYALFSALDEVPEALSRDGDLRLQPGPVLAIDRFVSRVFKFLNERLAAFRLSFYRVRGLSSVLRELVEAHAAWWQDEKYRDARDQLRAFCDQLDLSYAGNVLRRIETEVAEIEDAELRTFLAQLPAEVEHHRVRLADIAALTRGFERERIANAEIVANRLAEPAGPLCILGCGSEGVALTDGRNVFKVFDYWKSWQLESTSDYLRTLVGAWRNARCLYPLLAFSQAGGDAVLTYPFEPSEPYTGGYGRSLVDLLVECYQYGVVCRNIHPHNLRVAEGRVRLIDYGSDIWPLDNNEREFRAMCQRAWLSFHCHDRPDLKVLMRQALRRNDLPELAGFDCFHDAVLRMAGERQICEDVALQLAGRPRRVLDYGCGNGGLAKALADGGAEVVGYDPDRTRENHWRLLCNGMGDLRFTNERDEALAEAASGGFDLVVCQRVLCTVEEESRLRGILADLRTAVADDGRVVVTLCDPHFTFAGPTPEADRELPPGAAYGHTFVWCKTVRASGRRRREVHRPEEVLLREFARAGLRETRRTTVPTVDLMTFRPASDHLAFELVPIAGVTR